jgi:dolichyl-phosphate beta-glucosyltransferase
MHDVTLVIPCYNEERRLDREAVLALSRKEGIHVLLVDDGSKDGTARLLGELEARGEGRVRAMSLPANQGKSEAVRKGMLAVDPSVPFVGFADADFATPVDELARLASIMRAEQPMVLMGSRIMHAGVHIVRNPVRHYAGRVFATVASVLLRSPFYDTQCGAKLFRHTGLLRAALGAPFRSRWVFDVELIARLMLGVDGHRPLAFADFREVPLKQWTDVAGSKLTVSALARVGFDLGAIAVEVSRARKP